jgi:hypothetical protein
MMACEKGKITYVGFLFIPHYSAFTWAEALLVVPQSQSVCPTAATNGIIPYLRDMNVGLAKREDDRR